MPSTTPLGAADDRGADVIQVHLSAPRNWRDPRRREDADDLAASGRVVSAHAPYLCNPASADDQVRVRTTHSLQVTLDEADRCGIGGVVVHAGHAAGGGTLLDAMERWCEVAEQLESPVPLWIENTASGTVAPGRSVAHLGTLLARLRATDAVRSGRLTVGTCLDTCHAWAGDATCAADPATYVATFAEAVGGIDLLHVNDSRDEPGAGRDRHDNLGNGRMGHQVLAAMVRAADDLGVPAALVETPSDDGGHQRDISRLRDWLGAPAA